MLFLIGAAFGMRVRRSDRILQARVFGCAALANALVGIGLPVWCYVRYPAWMWGYYVRPETVSTKLVILVFASYWIPFLAGYAAPAVLERWKKGAFWWGIVAGAVCQGALIGWQWPRYSRVGTFDEFESGLAVPTAEVGFLNLAFPVAIAVMAALWFAARPARRPAA